MNLFGSAACRTTRDSEPTHRERRQDEIETRDEMESKSLLTNLGKGNWSIDIKGNKRVIEIKHRNRQKMVNKQVQNRHAIKDNKQYM
jgi:hypothetical protein